MKLPASLPLLALAFIIGIGSYVQSHTDRIVRDHVGSIVALVGDGGKVVEENSCDAWGRMRDPYVQDPTLPQNFNRFSYCLNNPLLYCDSSGEWFGIDDLFIATVGFVTGYLSNAISTGNWGWSSVKNGLIGAGMCWFGYKQGNKISRVGSHHELVQRVTQNFFHSLIGSKYYTDYSQMTSVIYSYYGTINPFNLWNY